MSLNQIALQEKTTSKGNVSWMKRPAFNKTISSREKKESTRLANRRYTNPNYGMRPKCTHVTHFKAISMLIFEACFSSSSKHTLCFAHDMLFFKPILSPRMQPRSSTELLSSSVRNLTDSLFLSKSHELIEKRTPDELARPDAP